MQPNGGGLEGQTTMMHPGQGPQGQARVMMVNGNMSNLGVGPLHQNGAGAPPTVNHTSDPMHPQHASWRASMEQQQQQQAHYLRGPPGQPSLRVQTAFAAQQPHPGQGGPPNGMLPSPLPLNLPPNTLGPPSRKLHRSLNSPHPTRPPPNPNPNHPAMPYRQQKGPPQPAPPSGPPTPLPMRQPSAPSPPNGQLQQVDPRVAAQLALAGCVLPLRYLIGLGRLTYFMERRVGPITASPSQVGPALAKLTALYDALHNALEVRSRAGWCARDDHSLDTNSLSISGHCAKRSPTS